MGPKCQPWISMRARTWSLNRRDFQSELGSPEGVHPIFGNVSICGSEDRPLWLFKSTLVSGDMLLEIKFDDRAVVLPQTRPKLIFTNSP